MLRHGMFEVPVMAGYEPAADRPTPADFLAVVVTVHGRWNVRQHTARLERTMECHGPRLTHLAADRCEERELS